MHQQYCIHFNEVHYLLTIHEVAIYVVQKVHCVVRPCDVTSPQASPSPSNNMGISPSHIILGEGAGGEEDK